MKRSFLINLFFLISINLLIKPFYIFGIDRAVQNLVGAETYGGWYASLLSFSYLLQIINDFGIQLFNNRNIAQHQQLLRKYLPNILVLKLMLGGVYMLITLGIGWFIGYDSIQFKILAFLAINQVLVSMIFYLRSNISGLHYYKTDSFFSALDKLLMIVFCGLLLWVPPFSDYFSIQNFVYAQTLSYVITVIVAFAWIMPKVNYQLKLRFSWPFIVLILKKSYPYALTVFLAGVFTRIDQVMLERLLTDGKEQAGIYAAAYRMLDASNMIGFLMAGLLLPMFAKLLQNKQSIVGLQQLGFKLLFVVSLTTAMLCWFYQVPIMTLLYDDATVYWGRILGILMFSFVAMGMSYVNGTLLSANGSLFGLNVVALCGAVLNIVLNAVLIGEYKAEGAAWATVFTQFLVAAGQWWLVFKIFKMRLNVKLLLRSIAFLIGVASIIYYTSQLPFLWIWTLLLGGFICLILAILLKLIDIKELIESFKS